jgi:hypothetical protein
VSVAKIEPDKGPAAVTPITLVHLLRVMVQLMTIEMLGPRIALATAGLGTGELLVQALAAPSFPSRSI